MSNHREHKRFFTVVILTGWVLLFLLARGVGAASYPGGVTGAQPGWKEAKPAYPLAASLTGGTGMLRLLSPVTPPKGSASVGAYARFFTSSDLIQGYNSRRLEGTGVFTYSITDYLETAVVTTGSSQRIENREIQPHQSFLAQTMGDFDLSLKAGYDSDPALSIGAEARMRVSAQVNDIGIQGDSISGGGRFLFSFDFSEVQYKKVKQFPLRLLFNLGYFHDRSYNLAPPTQNQTPEQQSQFSQAAFNYALGIGTGGYVGWGLGAEIPLRYFTPFLEYYDELIYDRETKKFRSFNQSPQRITPGIRITPLENLGIIVGVDISAGMNKKYSYSFSRTVEEIAAQPAPNWAVIVGINYLFGAEKKCPMLGILTGKITDIDTKLPLENAQITFPETAVSPIVTDSGGKFRVYQPEGTVKVSAWKEGFFDHSEMILVTPCQEAVVDFNLKVIQKAGLLSGRVSDPGGNPLAAVVTISVKPEGAPPAPVTKPKEAPRPAPAPLTATVVPPALKPSAPAPPASIPAPPAAQPVVKPNVPAAPTPPADKPKAKPVTKPRALLPGGKNMSNLFGQVLPPSAALRVGRIITGIFLIGALEGGQVVAQEVKPPAGAAPAETGEKKRVFQSSAKMGKLVLATDPATGEFNKTLPPGIYRVETNAAGYINQVNDVVVTEDQESHLEIILEPKKSPTGRLLGSVLSEKEKKPLAAIISLDQPGVPNLATDPNTGNFIGTLPPRKYQATAFAQNYLPQTKAVEIQNGEDTRVDFLLFPTEVPVELGDLRGTVTDKEGKPLAAVLSFPESEVPNVASEPDNGKYFLKLPPGTYTVKAAAVNHKSQIKKGMIVARRTTEIVFVLEPLQLVRLTKKNIQILEKIHFEYDKSGILPESFPILDEIAQVLSDNPTLKITIEGHTDIMGSNEYNMKLSQARVDSVRNYLIKKGINQDRLAAIGYGSTRPIADNTTALGRAKNRRVEFVIQQ